MHYYQHHIGDFIKATSRLSDGQAMAYLRLIWMYYDSEKPLPNHIDVLALQVGASHDDVHLLLRAFFKLNDNVWQHTRCDAEIAEYRANLTKKSNAGKASAERRLNKSLAGDEQVMNECSTDVQLTNNHKPITNKPIKEDAIASKSATAFPTCPHQEIIDLYAKHLPHLPKPRVWEGNRASMLRQRWVQASRPSTFSENGYKTVLDGLAWWDSFFSYIAKDTKLAHGFESQGRVWLPDLPWIVNSGNFAKIIDGKYAK